MDVTVLPSPKRLHSCEKYEMKIVPPKTWKVILAWEKKWDDEVQDLDLFCCIYNRQGEFIDAVSFGKERSSDGGIIHGGDHVHSVKEDNTEVIEIDFGLVHRMAASLVFCCSAFAGDFSGVRSITLTVAQHKVIQGMPFLKDVLKGSVDPAVFYKLESNDDSLLSTSSRKENITGKFLLDTLRRRKKSKPVTCMTMAVFYRSINTGWEFYHGVLTSTFVRTPAQAVEMGIALLKALKPSDFEKTTNQLNILRRSYDIPVFLDQEILDDLERCFSRKGLGSRDFVRLLAHLLVSKYPQLTQGSAIVQLVNVLHDCFYQIVQTGNERIYLADFTDFCVEIGLFRVNLNARSCQVEQSLTYAYKHSFKPFHARVNRLLAPQPDTLLLSISGSPRIYICDLEKRRVLNVIDAETSTSTSVKSMGMHTITQEKDASKKEGGNVENNGHQMTDEGEELSLEDEMRISENRRHSASKVKIVREKGSVKNGEAVTAVFENSHNMVEVLDVCYIPEKKIVVVSCTDLHLSFWRYDPSHNYTKWYANVPCAVPQTIVLPSLDNNRHFVFTSGIDLVINQYDVETRQRIRAFRAHEERITSLSFASRCRILVSASFDKDFAIWDVFETNSTSFAIDDSNHNRVRKWVNTGIKEEEGLGLKILSVSVKERIPIRSCEAKEDLLLLCFINGTATIWSLLTLKLVCHLSRFSNSISYAGLLSFDDTQYGHQIRAVSTNEYGEYRIWDISNLKSRNGDAQVLSIFDYSDFCLGKIKAFAWGTCSDPQDKGIVQNNPSSDNSKSFMNIWPQFYAVDRGGCIHNFQPVYLHKTKSPVSFLIYNSITKSVLALSNETCFFFDIHDSRLMKSVNIKVNGEVSVVASDLPFQRKLYIGTTNGSLHIQSNISYSMLRTTHLHAGAITGLQVCQFSQMIITCGQDGNVIISKESTSLVRLKMLHTPQSLLSLAYSPELAAFAISTGKQMGVWSLEGLQPICLVPVAQGNTLSKVTDVNFVKAKPLLVTCGGLRRVFLWLVTRPRERKRRDSIHQSYASSRREESAVRKTILKDTISTALSKLYTAQPVSEAGGEEHKSFVSFAGVRAAVCVAYFEAPEVLPNFEIRKLIVVSPLNNNYQNTALDDCNECDRGTPQRTEITALTGNGDIICWDVGELLKTPDLSMTIQMEGYGGPIEDPSHVDVGLLHSLANPEQEYIYRQLSSWPPGNRSYAEGIDTSTIANVKHRCHWNARSGRESILDYVDVESSTFILTTATNGSISLWTSNSCSLDGRNFVPTDILGTIDVVDADFRSLQRAEIWNSPIDLASIQEVALRYRDIIDELQTEGSSARAFEYYATLKTKDDKRFHQTIEMGTDVEDQDDASTSSSMLPRLLGPLSSTLEGTRCHTSQAAKNCNGRVMYTNLYRSMKENVSSAIASLNPPPTVIVTKPKKQQHESGPSWDQFNDTFIERKLFEQIRSNPGDTRDPPPFVLSIPNESRGAMPTDDATRSQILNKIYSIHESYTRAIESRENGSERGQAYEDKRNSEISMPLITQGDSSPTARRPTRTQARLSEERDVMKRHAFGQYTRQEVAQLADLIHSIDVSCNGKIGINEFNRFRLTLQDGAAFSSINFGMIDRKNRGYVTVQDMVAILFDRCSDQTRREIIEFITSSLFQRIKRGKKRHPFQSSSPTIRT